MQRAILALSALAFSACSLQMRAQASGSGSGASSAAGSAPPREKHEELERKSGGKSRGVGFSTSFHESGKISGKVNWQGRSGRLCRAAAPYKFVGVAKASGSAQLEPSGVVASGNASASGKTTGGGGADECAAPRSPVPKTPKPEPETTPRKPAKPEAAKPVKRPPQWGADKSEPKKPSEHGEDKKPADPPPAKPTSPTPEELEKPIDPPATPADNPFGYEKPVLGCFEGQVFPLKTDAAKLPTSYDHLAPVSVVYACEWDIPPRAWEQGFPGVADRFEWFAIRYAGAFRVAQGGEYTFRISSDDGAKLTIDGKLVIDNDGQHPPKEARGRIKLDAGDHAMVLEYFQGPRYHINLQLWVTPPDKPEELFTVR